MSKADRHDEQPTVVRLSNLLAQVYNRAAETVGHDVEVGATRLTAWISRQRQQVELDGSAREPLTAVDIDHRVAAQHTQGLSTTDYQYSSVTLAVRSRSFTVQESSERERELRRLWREACEAVGLCQWIPSPSGWSMAIPQIGHITLGDPTSMSVALRAGQMLADVIAVVPRIAQAMGVSSLRVTALSAPRWLKIELLNDPGPDDGVVTPMRPPTVSP